jgi:hypothetical protein
VDYKPAAPKAAPAADAGEVDIYELIKQQPKDAPDSK